MGKNSVLIINAFFKILNWGKFWWLRLHSSLNHILEQIWNIQFLHNTKPILLSNLMIIWIVQFVFTSTDPNLLQIQQIMPGQKIETGHTYIIHDVCMDYYGKRVISTSSDATIKIISVTTTISTATSHPLTTLTCHNGPVWQVAWAYPKSGSLLASHSDGILLQHILLGDSTTKVPSFLNYINYFMGLSNLVFFLMFDQIMNWEVTKLVWEWLRNLLQGLLLLISTSQNLISLGQFCMLFPSLYLIEKFHIKY